MATGDWKKATKPQAVALGLFAVLLLANNLYAVLAEGARTTIWYWIVQIMDVGLLVFSVWWYRRAAKNPPSRG
jgi:hypothetical protein